MKIEHTMRDPFVVVTVDGRMDALTAPEFDTACEKLVTGGQTRFVVDLAGLEYISSAGLRAILTVAKQLKATGGTLAFCGLTGMVQEVFRISGFLKMFSIFATVEEASAA